MYAAKGFHVHGTETQAHLVLRRREGAPSSAEGPRSGDGCRGGSPVGGARRRDGGVLALHGADPRPPEAGHLPETLRWRGPPSTPASTSTTGNGDDTRRSWPKFGAPS